MKYKKFLILLFGILTLLSAPLLFTSSASADIADLTIDTGCDADNLPTYTGVLKLDPQAYDVYVRLSKRGEQAQVRGYVQTADDKISCQKLGDLTASGDRWTHLGKFNASQAQEYVLQLSSPALDKLPDANRPSIMLVPSEDPVCVPNIECEVTINGETGYIRPIGTLLNQDSLHVVEVTPPQNSDIKTVRYYVDNKLVYTKANLAPFDLRYVSYPKQKLTRAVEYASGQQVILRGEVPNTYQDSFSNLVFRTGQQYPTLYTTLLILISLVLIAGAGLALARAIWHHRNWDYNHGLLKRESHELSERERILVKKQQRLLLITKMTSGVILTLCTVIGTIFLTDTYVAQIYTVDGISMQNTRFTGDKILVSKIQKTFAATNNREYIPKRGDVVVAHAVFGTSALSSENTTDIYIIKRVIGLPGERVVIKDGIVKIYNHEYPNGFEPDKESSWQSSMVPNEKDEQLDVQLSSSELFISGDNRPASIDSRFNGPIAAKEIVGQASFKLWPIGESNASE